MLYQATDQWKATQPRSKTCSRWILSGTAPTMSYFCVTGSQDILLTGFATAEEVEPACYTSKCTPSVFVAVFFRCI